MDKATVLITHGGMATINEAIWSALPMLCLPAWWDHFGNAQRVVSKGLGRAIFQHKKWTADRLEHELECLLQKGAYRDRVENWSATIRKNDTDFDACRQWLCDQLSDIAVTANTTIQREVELSNPKSDAN